MFTPRPYQVDAINAGVDFFKCSKQHNGFQILPTGSGKSVVIANVGMNLPGKSIVFQPSKEILVQNFQKFSSSAGHKFRDKLTFATIGSGLTATPYRLTAGFDGAMLKFLNRTNPRIFNKLLYFIQNRTLFDAGHLARLEYYKSDVIDRTMLQMNSSGTDFTDASLKQYYRKIDFPSKTINFGNRLLQKRKNLLIFCALIEEANKVSAGIPGSVVLTGETPQDIRDSILLKFKAGKIRCVVNVGVLTTGFDYPELECVLLARSTMSLALYYQIIGRVMRPHPNKDCGWVVDLGGNFDFFGKIETMEIREIKGLYSIWNNGRQLTNVTFTKK